MSFSFVIACCRRLRFSLAKFSQRFIDWFVTNYLRDLSKLNKSNFSSRSRISLFSISICWGDMTFENNRRQKFMRSAMENGKFKALELSKWSLLISPLLHVLVTAVDWVLYLLLHTVKLRVHQDQKIELGILLAAFECANVLLRLFSKAIVLRIIQHLLQLHALQLNTLTLYKRLLFLRVLNAWLDKNKLPCTFP